ncbi:hypothetical protein [Paenibacillus nasutitermitis]|uniref:Lipoprotein n=1 Tax=Paenibacillus nasutitermitis TaxID=1652958 RepID=A0A916YV53_9BACL|nr:hypothetical protein [Paenibacillus nasutitermitis]GGD62650.1 hypothetical protein GCM10010911_20580 [Paenibacillus nasutitermitis]
MLRSRYGIIFIVCMIALVGCSKDNNVKKNEYSLQDVIVAIESQNLKLASFGMTGTLPTLNGIIPEVNSIEGEATADHTDPEFVYFYIFSTEAARKSGVKEFNKQMKDAKFTTYPFLHEKGNILTIYWAKSKEKPLFNEPIKSAIEKL